VLPFDLPSEARERVAVSDGVMLATVHNGTEQVLLAPGRGANAGEVCLTLANDMGPTDVSPIVCRAPSAIDDPGFHYSEQRPGQPSWALHVRIPNPDDLRSAIVTEYVIPAHGGEVTIDSGGRKLHLSFPDLTELNARADRDARAFAESLRRRARTQLAAPDATRRLEALPATLREALELRVLGDLSYAEIAKRVGSTVMEARDRVSRALDATGVDLDGMLP
jgi:hypothetical protein